MILIRDKSGYEQDKQCTQRKVHARSLKNCCHRQVMDIAYSEYVFLALLPRYTSHILGIILSSMACPALQFIFSTLFDKRHDIRKISHCVQNMCFHLVYNFCVKCFSS
jgi:hypothetical protein